MYYCEYCGQTYPYAVCPYDGSRLGVPWQAICNLRHNLDVLPPKYQPYQMYVTYSQFRTVAACPNCKTPYFYSSLPYDLKARFNRERLAQGCFIATSAMGSHLHPYVQSLREFRDNILLQSRHKDTFERLLKFYYSFSPTIARVMSKHKPLKIFLRYSLVYPIVFSIKLALPIFNVILGIEKDANQRKRTGSRSE